MRAHFCFQQANFGKLCGVMTAAVPQLILASASPRRRDLLGSLGLEFTVVPSDIDETPYPDEAAPALVERLSRAKAEAVAADHANALVIAADTVVVLDEAILGKPKDENENRHFLERLAGRDHEVYTGHALVYQRRSVVATPKTVVRFRDLSSAEIDRYVATGEGLDKAGGYAIQGYGAALVPRVEGCYFNVVGLSLATLVELAAELGVALV